MPNIQKIPQPIQIGLHSFKFKVNAYGAYVSLIKKQSEKRHEIRINNELFVWDKSISCYISVVSGSQLAYADITAFKNRVEAVKATKLSKVEGRICVVVSTIIPTGLCASKEVLGLQFWTSEMITAGASQNSDKTWSTFIDYNF